jgi:hypothetical protein
MVGTMEADPVREETFEEARAQASHHRGAMVERRNIGLRIVVGIVAFDLLVLKLALDAADQVSDQSELTWAIRGIAVFALIVLTGMLVQLEIRNRGDRQVYRAAERRMEAIRRGEDPAGIEAPEEALSYTVRQAWATTWPLLGVAVLTVAIFVMAGLLAHSDQGHPASQHVATGQSLP